jgi:hypothetical protein
MMQYHQLQADDLCGITQSVGSRCVRLLYLRKKLNDLSNNHTIKNHNLAIDQFHA